MLMDRQLPKGGWNYGNTSVYGLELYPQMENTGLALSALPGYAPKKNVQPSLDYLGSAIRKVRTPLSLGWGLLGLGAWGDRPAHSRAWVMESLKRQEKHGSYDTTLLSLLSLAFLARGGLAEMFGG
jgi:hypothetical protein